MKPFLSDLQMVADVEPGKRSHGYSVMVNDPPGDNDAELEVSSPGYATVRRTVHHSRDESQDVCLEPSGPRT